MKLSAKHIAFIEAYMINGFNATGAYKTAYPKANQRTAETNGSDLLGKTEVKQEIERRQAELRERNKITLDALTQRLITIADNTQSENPQASIAAIKLLAQMHGLDTAKEQSTTPIQTGPTEIKINIIKKKDEEKGND